MEQIVDILQDIAQCQKESQNEVSRKDPIQDFGNCLINLDIDYQSLNRKNALIKIQEADEPIRKQIYTSQYGSMYGSHNFWELQQPSEEEIINDITYSLKDIGINEKLNHFRVNELQGVSAELYREFEKVCFQDDALFSLHNISKSGVYDLKTGQYQKNESFYIDPQFKNYQNSAGIGEFTGQPHLISFINKETDQNQARSAMPTEKEIISQLLELVDGFQPIENPNFHQNIIEESQDLNTVLEQNAQILSILSMNENVSENYPIGQDNQEHQNGEKPRVPIWTQIESLYMGDYSGIMRQINLDNKKINQKTSIAESMNDQEFNKYVEDTLNIKEKDQQNRRGEYSDEDDSSEQESQNQPFQKELEEKKIHEESAINNNLERQEEQDHEEENEKEEEEEQKGEQEEEGDQDQEETEEEKEIRRKFQRIKLTEGNSYGKRSGKVYDYAIEDESDLSNFYDQLPKEQFALPFQFQLDSFQQRAILHLERGESVFVCAHTSAGKTVVAEYSIALAKQHRRRVVYTSPIQALSNQKYRDFCQKFGDVGIITGDVTLNPGAFCLIMTTEILRNMLYRGSDIVRDIQWVIFDQVHYVNNAERGVVWEETIIMLPEHIGLIMLSATAPNYMDFANWVGRTKQRKIFVQKTFTRPVPLEHSLYILGSFYKIKEPDGKFLQKEYEAVQSNIDFKAIQDKLDAKEIKNRDLIKQQMELGHFKNNFEAQKLNYTMKKANEKFIKKLPGADLKTYREEKRSIMDLIRNLQQKELLPCVLFCFSKNKITQIAQGMLGMQLVTLPEQKAIVQYFNHAIKKLKPEDREIDQLKFLRELLKRGLAVHHGDLLPIAKEIVEILFSEGLIKVLFATETFAMGINMPTKTVIFHSLKKNDGNGMRFLNSSQYTQMSGRAGRRGLDEKGTVILFFNDARYLPEQTDLKQMVDNPGESLESKFKIDYGIILNLLTSKDINVLQMMRRSFAENDQNSEIPQNIILIKQWQNQLKSSFQFDCPFKSPVIDQYPMESFWKNGEDIREMNQNILLDDSTNVARIQWPKFAIAFSFDNKFEFGLILQQNQKDTDVFLFLFIVSIADLEKKKIQLSYEKAESYETATKSIKNNKNFMYSLSPIYRKGIIEIFNDKINLNIPKNANFEKDENLVSLISEELIRQNQSFNVQQYYTDRKKKYNLAPMTFKLGQEETPYKDIRYAQVSQLMESKCLGCPMVEQHMAQVNKRQDLKVKIQNLIQHTDPEALLQRGGFEGRLEVLRELGYIDENHLPLIKARIARELGDIYICELLINNLLNPLDPAEIAGLLAGFVCQFQMQDDEEFDVQYEGYTDLLYDTVRKSNNIVLKVLEIEEKFQLIADPPDVQIKSVLNFALTKAIYEWAQGCDFVEIYQYTKAQEGVIVRTIMRLENLLRNIQSAAKLMGHMPLYSNIEQCSESIKRDIVFAQSLYFDE